MKSALPFQVVGGQPSPRSAEELRTIVYAPSGNDARLTVEVLHSVDLHATECRDIKSLGEEITRGCAVVIIAEEALQRDAPTLAGIVAQQPPWSDLPITIVTSDGEFVHRQKGLEAFISAGNITEIERPFRPETLLSTVRVAIRARLRQYDMRDLLLRLQNGEARVRQILESISDAFVSIDENWNIQFLNAAYMDLVSPLYQKPEELIGRNLWEKFPDLIGTPTADFYHRVMRKQIPETLETFYEPLDAWLEVRAFPSPHILSLYVQNVSARREAEIGLRAAKESAESASRAKDYFLAVLSHELRTPLTPVLMVATIRERDKNLPEEIRSEMAMISRNVQLETKLIDDLLDLSRITSGKVILSQQTIDLNAAVALACDTCRSQIVEQSVELVLDLADDAGRIEADPARLQQILWNILKNAIKFSLRGGRIEVETRRVSDEAAVVSVRDFGLGIDSDLLPKIFDAFEQGDARKNQQFGGLGLGLAITKALVDLHHGQIRAESDGIGRGSRFSVEFPASQKLLAQQEQQRPVSGSSQGLKILLVEDHIDTAAVLKTLLESMDFAVTAAHSGSEAIQLAKALPFDILLSDIGLPDMAGHELLRNLKNSHQFEAIAMSGYGMEEDLAKSRESGFSEHLVKPVTFAALQEAISRVLLRLG